MYSLDDNKDDVSTLETDTLTDDTPAEVDFDRYVEEVEEECEEEYPQDEETDENTVDETKTKTVKIKKFSFHILSSVLTFVLLPHFWCFSIPAIIFARESKKFFGIGNIPLSRYFANKAKKFIVSAWLVTAIVLAIIFLFSFILGLSLL